MPLADYAASYHVILLISRGCRRQMQDRPAADASAAASFCYERDTPALLRYAPVLRVAPALMIREAHDADRAALKRRRRAPLP